MTEDEPKLHILEFLYEMSHNSTATLSPKQTHNDFDLEYSDQYQNFYSRRTKNNVQETPKKTITFPDRNSSSYNNLYRSQSFSDSKKHNNENVYEGYESLSNQTHEKQTQPTNSSAKKVIKPKSSYNHIPKIDSKIIAYQTEDPSYPSPICRQTSTSKKSPGFDINRNRSNGKKFKNSSVKKLQPADNLVGDNKNNNMLRDKLINQIMNNNDNVHNEFYDQTQKKNDYKQFEQCQTNTKADKGYNQRTPGSDIFYDGQLQNSSILNNNHNSNTNSVYNSASKNKEIVENKWKERSRSQYLTKDGLFVDNRSPEKDSARRERLLSADENEVHASNNIGFKKRGLVSISVSSTIKKNPVAGLVSEPSCYNNKKSQENNIEIEPVSEKTINKLIKWQVDITLLKPLDGLEEKLPMICKNGELFCDLLNRLERTNIIKGVYTNSKKKSQIKSNYSKIFRHLSKFEKFNPRYYNSAEYLINANRDVFWGLLDDLYCFYNGKVSAYDKRYQNSNLTNRKNSIDTSNIESHSKIEVPTTSRNSSRIFNKNNFIKKNIVSLKKQSQKEDTKPQQAKDSVSPIKTNPSQINPNFQENRLQDYQNVQKHEEVNPEPLQDNTAPSFRYNIPAHVANKSEKIQNNIPLETPQDNASISCITNRSQIKNNLRSSYGAQYTKRSHLENTPIKSNPNHQQDLQEGIISTRRTSITKNPINRYSSGSKLQQNHLSNLESSVIQTNRKNSRYVTLECKDSMIEHKGKIDFTNQGWLQHCTQTWLEKIGIKSKYEDIDKSSLFNDSIRNGYYLCIAVSQIYNFPNFKKTVTKKPKSIQECSNNIEQALTILRENPDGLPYEFLWKKEQILKGDGNIVYPQFLSLKDQYDLKFHGKYQEIIDPEVKEYGNSETQLTLPYSKNEILTLQNSILNWLNHIRVLNGLLDFIPTNFLEIINKLKDGTILIKICSTIFREELKGIHRKPLGISNCMNNVTKVLEFLKKQKNMSKKFLYHPNDIVEGKDQIILGQLEDIHRYANNLAPRKDPNYFVDGPYIDELATISISKIEEKKEVMGHTDYNITFKSNYDNTKDYKTDFSNNFFKKNLNIEESPATVAEESNHIVNSFNPKNVCLDRDFVDQNLFTNIGNRVGSNDKYLRGCVSEMGQDIYQDENYGMVSPKTNVFSNVSSSNQNKEQHQFNMLMNNRKLTTNQSEYASLYDNQESPVKRNYNSVDNDLQQYNQDYVRKINNDLENFDSEPKQPQFFGTAPKNNKGKLDTKQNNAMPETKLDESKLNTIVPDADVLKICIELLLITGFSKYIEETDWSNPIWGNFKNG